MPAKENAHVVNAKGLSLIRMAGCEFHIISFVEEGNVGIFALTDGTNEALSEMAAVAPAWMCALDLPAVPLLLSVEESPGLPSALATVGVVDKSGNRQIDLRKTPRNELAGIFIDFVGPYYGSIARRLRRRCTCPFCSDPAVRPHGDGFHSLLHELTHVRFPDSVDDNEWTDKKVADLLVTPPSGCGIVAPRY